MNTIQEAPARPDARTQTITVLVNEKPVVFHQRKATGADIKAAAIEQGVAIQKDFTVFMVHGQGKPDQVADQEPIAVHENQKFRAIAPDDQS